MKHVRTASNTFQTIHGDVTIDLEVFWMDAVEAIDCYDLDRWDYALGGWRIEATINGIPRGHRNCPASGSPLPLYAGGDDTTEVARHFLAIAHQEGFFGMR